MFDDIISAKTFERLSENTYDHVPILVEYRIPEKLCIFSDQPTSAGSMLTQKVNWSNFSGQDLKEKYNGPLSVELATFDSFYRNDIEKASRSVTDLILHHSSKLVARRSIKKRKSYVRLPDDIRAARKSGNLAFNEWKLSRYPTDGPVEAA